MKLTVRRLFADLVAVAAATAPAIIGADSASLEDRLNALEAQNRRLQAELAEQKATVEHLKSRVAPASTSADLDLEVPNPSALKFGQLHISGEGGVAYFHTGSDGQYPGGSFRVDEAKLFVEAPLWESTYIFVKL